jgi:hypothetical protein
VGLRHHRIGSEIFAASANGRYAPPQPHGALMGVDMEDTWDMLSDRLEYHIRQPPVRTTTRMSNVSLNIDVSLHESLRLWRYMDLAKLISLLEKKAIWLARVDTLRDKHEGRFPDEMRVLPPASQ